MSHDIFNASSTATWIECSYSALHAVPDPPKKASTTVAAEAGTAQHEDMEAGDMPDVEAFLAQLEEGPLYREERVKITDDCGGTVDVLKLPDRARIVTVLDGKFGKWDVSAFHNMQLLTYSAAVLPYTDADWFRLVIFQPNGLDEDSWKQWVASRNEVEAHKQRVLRQAARVARRRRSQRAEAWAALPLVQSIPSLPSDAHGRRFRNGRHVAPYRGFDDAGTCTVAAAYSRPGRRQRGL
jgi:hypothetical protein